MAGEKHQELRGSKESPGWERIGVPTVNRKGTGLKDAPERRLDAVLKSSGVRTPLGEMGFGPLCQPRVTLRVEGRPVDLRMNPGNSELSSPES